MCFLLIHTHSYTDGCIGRCLFIVLPKEASTCGPGKPELIHWPSDWWATALPPELHLPQTHKAFVRVYKGSRKGWHGHVNDLLLISCEITCKCTLCKGLWGFSWSYGSFYVSLSHFLVIMLWCWAWALFFLHSVWAISPVLDSGLCCGHLYDLLSYLVSYFS